MCTCIATWLRRIAFPMLFGAAGIVAWWGYAPANAGWLMPLLVAAVGLAAYGLEQVIPFEPSWNSGAETRSDLAYLASTAVFSHVGEAIAWSAAIAAASLLPLVEGIWPREWPILVQVGLALAVGDFLPYLYHRVSHESTGFLWRVHAVHHAPERLYSLNFARFHPLNAALTAGLTLVPLVALGAEPSILFLAGVLHNVHGVLSHANVDFRLGPLNAVFSMAELHRWHHARDPALANGNYGATLLIWDWAFGTRRDPGRRVSRDGVGLWPGSTVASGWMGQWLRALPGVIRMCLSRASAGRHCCMPKRS